MPKARTSPIPSTRRKRKPSKHVVVRDVSIREANAIQVILSGYENDYWKLYWTRAGNFVMPTHEAARYVMVRLYDASHILLSGNEMNAKGAQRVADKIAALLPDE